MRPVDGADEEFGVTGSELGTYTIDGTNISGTANKVTVPNWGGVGVSEEGYFILLHFDNAKRFYCEAQPEGKDFDETGNLLFRLGTDAITAKWLDVEDDAGTRVRYTIEVTAAAPPTLTNTIGAEKWGFAKTATELDSIVGPGESSYIDHDDDVFYLALKARIAEDGKKYVDILKVDGKTYACFHGSDSWQYAYTGLGANRGEAHKTDYDWVSDDGTEWKSDKTSKTVDGKTVTMEVWKYEEGIDDANAETALKGSHEVVFGPQEIACDQTRSFSAPARVSYAAMTKAKLRAEAEARGISVPKSATKTQLREALEEG